MDKLKKELNNLVEKYGPIDPRVLKKSQEVDLLIVKEMKVINEL